MLRLTAFMWSSRSARARSTRSDVAAAAVVASVDDDGEGRGLVKSKVAGTNMAGAMPASGGMLSCATRGFASFLGGSGVVERDAGAISSAVIAIG